MSKKINLVKVFDLSGIDLRRRFAVLLGAVALVSLVLFFLFSRYSIGVTENEFEKRGELLAQTLGSESVYNLIMQDEEGLRERLNTVVETGTAVAGAFYSTDGRLLVDAKVNEVLKDEDRSVASRKGAWWSESQTGEPILIAVQDVVNVNNNQERLGKVMAVLSAETIATQQRTSLILSIIISVIIALLAYLSVLIVRRTVIKPVDKLREAAGMVEHGDLSVRVEVDQKDEIGQLAASFNAMVEASALNLGALQKQKEQSEAAERQADELRRSAEEERKYLQTQFDRISEVIEAVTRGNLTVRLHVEREDGVGRLMHQINQMIGDLESLINEVQVAGSRLSQAAHQVATSAEEMSAGAHGQANQTIEVAAAIEEMSATISESSRNAHEANQMAHHASKIATEGESVFHETSQGMTRIAEIVKESAEKVTALGASSAQIGEIVQVIGDIADQTNLLALNAAIEAARAGDQGRGFAVVADEVRKLAERTTSATKEIGSMIRRIQQNTDEVVASMTRGNTEVEAGLKLAENASRSLGEIVHSINNMVTMIDQIAAGSQQQATSSSQISRNVESISSVATEVSNATMDLARTADTMNQQAETLRKIIERFHINSRATEYNIGVESGDGAPVRF